MPLTFDDRFPWHKPIYQGAAPLLLQSPCSGSAEKIVHGLASNPPGGFSGFPPLASRSAPPGDGGGSGTCFGGGDALALALLKCFDRFSVLLRRTNDRDRFRATPIRRRLDARLGRRRR